MIKKIGKSPVNKTYAVVTRLDQPYINWTGDQIDIDGILEDREKKPVIFSEGLWLEIHEMPLIFVGYTVLCMYLPLKCIGMDELVVQLYGKKEPTDEEKEQLIEIRYC
ncbi:hypothetical protein KTJ53_15945 [Acinetobacter variabilis]|uniref:hypothetical protein n=1 Tax=Acinetobacter variabilis TaxID=70346 RepID=UPI0015D18628|nr:hypothetical protein [Acinetobacter variabilis]MCU4631126.1 hypothetical protein [Acinetobacter variabilis]